MGEEGGMCVALLLGAVAGAVAKTVGADWGTTFSYSNWPRCVCEVGLMGSGGCFLPCLSEK